MGVGVWDLQLPGCHSLKEKRGIVRPVVHRLRTKLNLSVAETGHQDQWQRAELACATVAGDRVGVERILRAADECLEGADGIRIIDAMVEYR